MYLAYLGLTNFRTYRRLALSLPPGPSVFQGENGQGKTNLLEAIHFLATTRSPRASADRELVAWEAAQDGPLFARLEARVQKRGGELHVEILLREEEAGEAEGALARTRVPASGREPAARLSPGPSPAADGQAGTAQRPGGWAASPYPPGLQLAKAIKVNGLPTRASQLVGQVNVVFFSPEDLNLVSGPPAGRRRYLDITNSQVNHLYLRALQRFNRVLTQRNHLLRQVRERRQPRELLDFWTDELVRAGTYVLRQRLEMIAAVNRSIGEIYRQLAGGGSELRLAYETTAAYVEEGQQRLAYRERLAELGDREIEAGVTLVGPHRDDFAFLVDGVEASTYGSRGQQRLAVLALRLAEADYMRSQTEEEPILLLDDILSELDTPRRRFVLARIARAGQSLITTADLGPFTPEFLSGTALFRVQRGQIMAEGSGLATPA